MNITDKIMKEFVRFKRAGSGCNTILLGRQEIKELREFDFDIDDTTKEALAEELSAGYNIHVIKVDEDSYLSGAYILSEEERVAKLVKELEEGK